MLHFGVFGSFFDFFMPSDSFNLSFVLDFFSLFMLSASRSLLGSISVNAASDSFASFHRNKDIYSQLLIHCRPSGAKTSNPFIPELCWRISFFFLSFFFFFHCPRPLLPHCHGQFLNLFFGHWTASLKASPLTSYWICPVWCHPLRAPGKPPTDLQK